jgi:hypothetical protein
MTTTLVDPRFRPSPDDDWTDLLIGWPAHQAAPTAPRNHHTEEDRTCDEDDRRMLDTSARRALYTWLAEQTEPFTRLAAKTALLQPSGTIASGFWDAMTRGYIVIVGHVPGVSHPTLYAWTGKPNPYARGDA